MFFDEKLTARISSYSGETGKRKDEEPENLIVIAFSGTGSADLLAHINPSMRSRFYKKDESPDMIGEKGDSKLAVPEIDNKHKVPGKVSGVDLSISYGIGSDIVLEGVDVYARVIELLEGGNVVYKFKIRSEKAAARDVGIIHETLNGREVDLILKLPTSPQSEIDC